MRKGSKSSEKFVKNIQMHSSSCIHREVLGLRDVYQTWRCYLCNSRNKTDLLATTALFVDDIKLYSSFNVDVFNCGDLQQSLFFFHRGQVLAIKLYDMQM